MNIFRNKTKQLGQLHYNRKVVYCKHSHALRPPPAYKYESRGTPASVQQRRQRWRLGLHLQKPRKRCFILTLIMLRKVYLMHNTVYICITDVFRLCWCMSITLRHMQNAISWYKDIERIVGRFMASSMGRNYITFYWVMWQKSAKALRFASSENGNPQLHWLYPNFPPYFLNATCMCRSY